MTAREEAIALLERYYGAFHKGDTQAMLACLSDDVAHDINQGAREQGKQAFAAFMGGMDVAYKEELRDMVIMANEEGARAAVEFVVYGRYLDSQKGLPPAHGQTYVLPAGAFFKITDGLISRVSVYYNLQDWIRQVS